MKSLLDIRSISFAYRDKIVIENISLAIQSQDVIAVIGPNGAGKTTLIKLMLGLLTPYSGTITRHISTREMGYVPQYIANDYNFPATVAEILGIRDRKRIYTRASARTDATASDGTSTHAPAHTRTANSATDHAAVHDHTPARTNAHDRTHMPAHTPVRAAKKDRTHARTRTKRRATRHQDSAHTTHIHDVITRLGLANIVEQKFIACSVGQQQRVLIALALHRNPRLLILDEPTAGIDIQAKQQFYDLLAYLSTQGIAIILITHEVTILPPFIRHVLCINNSVCCQGPLHQLPDMLPKIYGAHVIHHHNHPHA